MNIYSFMKKNSLLLLMQTKNCTVEDIKVESLLMMVHNLLSNYLYAEKNGLTKPFFQDDKYEESHKFLLNSIENLIEFLNSRIQSVEKINSLIEEKNPNKMLLVEPLYYFYNILAREYTKYSKNLMKDQKSGKTFWMPDLLAFSLITGLKDKILFDKYSAFNFNNYDLINKYNFKKEMEIYKEFSVLINEQTGRKFLAPKKERNIIAKTQLIADNMLMKLINSKYTINNKQIKKNKKR